MKKIIIVFLSFGFFFSCKSGKNIYENVEYFCNSTEKIVLSFEVQKDLTFYKLKEKVCQRGCSGNIGYTGGFSLMYDYVNKSFSCRKNCIELYFIGYKCPDSMVDFFSPHINVEFVSDDFVNYNERKINNQILRHKISARFSELMSIEMESPLINIIVSDNQCIYRLSELISSILNGYMDYQRDYVLKKKGQDILKTKLSKTEILQLTERAPLRLRLMPKDGYLYCK